MAPAEEFPPGAMKLIVAGAGLYVGVYNCGGQLYAIEDRCSHDDGPLCEGDWDQESCWVVCPRHGSQFDLATGVPRSLPATEVATLDKDELLEEIGIPLTPVRLKCAMLGLTTLKVALHKAKGTPLPEEWSGMLNDLDLH